MKKLRITIIFVFLIVVFYLSSEINCHAASLLIGMEKQIGVSGYQQIIREKRVVQLAPDKTQHLNGIFNKLVEQSSRKDEMKFSLTVIQDEEVNAYALPGGYVFINTGLLSLAETDAEIAGVLAHEIAHIDRKHGMNAVSRTIGFSLLIEILANKSKKHERAAQLGGIAIGLVQRGYSRQAEFQADKYGVRFMTAAGYSKNGMNFFLGKLQNKYGSGDELPLLHLFSTHPPTGERIKRLEQM